MSAVYRDTRAEIDTGAIERNLSKIRRRFPASVRLMAVVKANGYGHGALESARAAEAAGADMLGTALLEEAVRLREDGITLPILVLMPVPPQYAELAAALDIRLTVTEAEWFERREEFRLQRKPSDMSGLDDVNAANDTVAAKRTGHLNNANGSQTAADDGPPLRVHIKLDTGLGRIGLRNQEEWNRLLPWLKRSDIVTEGIFTHFATAGWADTSFVRLQYERFLTMTEWAHSSGIYPTLVHCCGSASALRFPDMALDMIRIGAAAYGFYPAALAPQWELEPALTLRSALIQAKKVGAGDTIGYDRAYKARGEEWIGTVPIGYADGWSQIMQHGEVLVGGRRTPIVGRIGMDQLTIRLPGPCRAGDPVILIGSQGGEHIFCAEAASRAGIVPQEITASLTERVPRSLRKDQKNEGLSKEEELTWKIKQDTFRS
ncbi:alanine racemase [Saccharibacillus kuerlensis]|uniref:Alanine racemase n=1 Tax=Saccharibacillus kuerlensis TaxID=459527 RepID=A0ABQ2L5Y6_9BACL|nr:alanine racemase [Saccharibacillus kuerlensis]GGO04557.1 alanine racemase [Saccharibacillus kuerlensis]